MATGKKTSLELPPGYTDFLSSIKSRIQAAQIKASVAINRELITLYWDIGKQIVERQTEDSWGKAVVEQVAADLQQAFPGIKGFSSRNLWRMRAFYLSYTQEVKQLTQDISVWDGRNLPQVVAEIPWGHNILLLEKIKDPTIRLWYIHKTIENAWSRSVLDHQIDTKLYERQVEANKTTNFSTTLPKPQSDLAVEILKDPYNFDFLTLAEDAQERDLEKALIGHIRDFLLELGVGFSFIASQYHLDVGDDDYYLDLLFYHFRLHCFVVIDLKVKEFIPEFSGKMNFYVSVVDDLLKSPEDNPTIGIILCKTKNKTTVEYALRDIQKPIGVSTYQLQDALPEKLQGNLPTIEQLEMELNTISVDVVDETATDEQSAKG